MSQTTELPQTAPTREHLRRARRHLAVAQESLDRSEPAFRDAAAHVERCYREALAALATWHCVVLPEDADVRACAGPAIRLASILRTPARRALAVLPVLRQVVTRGAVTVHDREGVDTAWYVARNLLDAVEGELPAGVVRAENLAGPPVERPRAAKRPSRPAAERPVPVLRPTHAAA